MFNSKELKVLTVYNLKSVAAGIIKYPKCKIPGWQYPREARYLHLSSLSAQPGEKQHTDLVF